MRKITPNLDPISGFGSGSLRIHIVEKHGQRCDVVDMGMRNEDVLDGLLDRERRDKSDTARVDGNVVVDYEGRQVLMS
jgi:hypothetical protein